MTRARARVGALGVEVFVQGSQTHRHGDALDAPRPGEVLLAEHGGLLGLLSLRALVSPATVVQVNAFLELPIPGYFFRSRTGWYDAPAAEVVPGLSVGSVVMDR